MARLLLLLVLSSFGFALLSCQSGRLPCPKPQSAKLQKSGNHKRYKAYYSSLTAKVDEDKESQRKSKSEDPKFVKNVSVEEWDCPEPGSRKYLPKRVKDNIRRNAKKMNQDAAKSTADSVAFPAAGK
jgi:hypothetical protein